ncbi:GH39 family glycosyl hydrolase, partial [Falsiroseomonas oryziterrae]|uniref:GH39 family glycosyl hydrolase n=1 Tax=Falsiroseomonas oryziterrae TaxID=2911368 RepID=UPI001F229E71
MARRIRRLRLSELSILAAMVLAVGAWCAAPASAQGVERRREIRVEVAFGQPMQAHSMVGFLHGLSREAPPRELIRPLRPRLWRLADAALAAEAREMGALVVLGGLVNGLPGYWGYGPRGQGNPMEDLPGFTARIREHVGRHRHLDVAWGVWNEPDVRGSWGYPREDFFRTYLEAYRTIRRVVGPDRWIGGPEIGHFDLDYLRQFLDFCLAQGCEVNYLSWHENDPVGQLPGLPARVAQLRALTREPRYAPLRIRELIVGEVLGPRDQLRPGALLGAFHYLEASGVDRAAKSCWREAERPSNNCFNASLDGLLDRVERRPRPIWWAAQAYAQGIGQRVQATSSSPATVAFASRRSGEGGPPQILLGSFEAQDGAAVRIVANGLEGILRATAVEVAVTLLPDDTAPVERAALVVRRHRVPLRELDAAGIVVEVPRGGAAVLELRPAAGEALRAP